MTNSYRQPFWKDKSRWFQLYYNRRERRLAKEYLNRGQYELAEGRLVPKNYDVIDYVYTPYKFGVREELKRK